MPTKPEKKPSNTADILKELQTLNENVEELHAFLQRTNKRARKRRISNSLVGGIFNAIGVIIGTIIISGILLYAGQALIRSDAFQDWIATYIQRAVTQSVINEFQSQ